MKEIVGVGVFGEIGGHGTDHAKIIRVLSNVRKEVTDRESGLAIVLELPRAGENLADAIELSGLDVHELAWILSIVLVQHRLGVEGVDVRHPTVHVEKDDAFGPWLKMRTAWFQGVKGRMTVFTRGIQTREGLVLEQGRKGSGSKAHSA